MEGKSWDSNPASIMLSPQPLYHDCSHLDQALTFDLSHVKTYQTPPETTRELVLRKGLLLSEDVEEMCNRVIGIGYPNLVFIKLYLSISILNDTDK